MKMNLMAAAAVSVGMPCALLAGGHDGSGGHGAPGAPGAPRGAPPPFVLSQINLSKAGLLMPYYSETQFGMTQARVGQNRSRIGAVGAGSPSVGHENQAFTLIAPIYARKKVGPGNGYLTFKLVGVDSDERPNLVEEDSHSTAFSVGYQNFYSPTAMYAFQIEYKDFSLESSAITIDRESVQLRFDYANAFSERWGVHARALYSMGDNDLLIKGPSITESQPDDYLYLEANLVGTFKSGQLGLVPQGWTLHPQIGISFQRNWEKDTTNSVGAPVSGSTDDQGSVLALAKFEKNTHPGGWAPYFEFGLEHVYKDDLDLYSNETSYVVGGFGVTRVSKSGTALIAAFQRRHGFKGERIFDELVLSANISF